MFANICYLLAFWRLEKTMAPHSSTLAWKIPWTEEPGRLRSVGSLRVGHNWATSLSLFTFMHWRRKWQPTPVFLPGESQGGGAWWATVCGVAQSRTRLKRLRTSSNSSIFLNIAILTSVRWYLIVILICITLMASDFEHSFMYLLVICVSFGKMSVWSPVHVLIELFFAIELWVLSVFWTFTSFKIYVFKMFFLTP